MAQFASCVKNFSNWCSENDVFPKIMFDKFECIRLYEHAFDYPREGVNCKVFPDLVCVRYLVYLLMSTFVEQTAYNVIIARSPEN